MWNTTKFFFYPRTFFVIVINVSACCFGACPSIFSSTKGHLKRYRTQDLDLMSGDLRDSIKVSFRGRSMGGRSGDNETFLVWPRRFFVPVSHLSRWTRSTKRRMIPAFDLWLNRWQAARCQVAASSTLRTSCANWIHLARVVCSSSPAGPSIPWIIMFHFRRWYM